MRDGHRILSIDFGTMGCKVGVFNEKGSLLARSEGAYGIYSPGFGLYEQDDSEWRATLLRCLSAINSHAKSSVEIVSITGQGSTSICLDSKGKVLGPILSHIDTRSHQYAKRIESGMGSMGYVPSKMITPLIWVKENRPDVFRRIHRIADIREYVGYLMTGSVTYDSASYPKPLLNKFLHFVGVPEEVLGDPHDNSSPIGRISSRPSAKFGIREGTPVLIAPFDGMCSVVGAGVDRTGLAANIAGSTEVLAAPVARDSKLGVIPHVIKGNSLFYISPPLGFLHHWFRDQFYGRSRAAFFRMERDASITPPGCNGLLCVPDVQYVGFHSRSALNFYNLTTSSRRREMSRAVMEGIALYARAALSRLRSGGVEITQVRLGGGGARSELWNQIRADVYGVEVALPQTLDVGCLGAAIFASVSLGLYHDFEDAISEMTRVGQRYTPRDQFREEYDVIFSRFLDASGSTGQ